MINRLRAFAVRAMLVLGSVAVTLIALEVMVRIFLPQQLILIRPDIWQPDAIVGWKKAGNLDTAVNWGERTVRLITNDQGHRIGTENASTPQYRVLAVGDSFVEALQVEYEDTMTAQLERNLSEKLGQPVQVVNAGVGGWGPEQYRLEIMQEVARSEYDLVIVFIYLDNDIEIQRTYEFPARAPVIQHSLRWPQNLASSEVIDSLLYPINDFLETRSHLFLLIRSRLENIRMRLGLSPVYLPDTIRRDNAFSPAWDVTGSILEEIANSTDIPVLFILLPPKYAVMPEVLDQYLKNLSLPLELIDVDQPRRLLSQQLDQRGLLYFDATVYLIEAYQNGETDLYGRVDVHFDRGGHRLMGDLTSEYVLPFLSAQSSGD